MRWWSALALLRSLGSSPAAAAATLRTRADNLTAQTVEEADELGRLAVMDDAGDEGPESLDSAPGALDEDDDARAGAERKRLLALATARRALAGDADTKLQARDQARQGARQGRPPADRVLPLHPDRRVRRRAPARSARQEDRGRRSHRHARARRARGAHRRSSRQHEQHVLVATDCLSEGINLQDGFDAVIHYDLAWNPTRHEQREGRVDRFGQQRDTVRAVTFYASNSPIDGIVLEVLLRKHERIRSQLGVSVPMPADAGKVADAILEGVVARGRDDLSFTEQLSLFAEVSKEHEQELHKEWDAASEREKRTNTVYAQHAIHTDEVARELDEARDAIGDVASVERFASAAIDGARRPRPERAAQAD